MIMDEPSSVDYLGIYLSLASMSKFHMNALIAIRIMLVYVHSLGKEYVAGLVILLLSNGV